MTGKELLRQCEDSSSDERMIATTKQKKLMYELPANLTHSFNDFIKKRLGAAAMPLSLGNRSLESRCTYAMEKRDNTTDIDEIQWFKYVKAISMQG